MSRVATATGAALLRATADLHAVGIDDLVRHQLGRCVIDPGEIAAAVELRAA